MQNSKPRYSILLSDRRRQLGLSISQAARVLRLKEQALMAFEDGEWSQIPRSGYAQAMLSSYARYLGLNPREVVELFEHDLDDYSRQRRSGQTTQDETAQIIPGSEDNGANKVRRGLNISNTQYNTRIRSSSNDLYGSAGPAGSILNPSVFDTSASGSLSSSKVSRSTAQHEAYDTRYTSSSNTTGSLNRIDATQLPHNVRESDYAHKRERVQRLASRYAGSVSSNMPRRRPTQSYSDDLRYDPAEPYESGVLSLRGARTSRTSRDSHRKGQQRIRQNSPERANVRRRIAPDTTHFHEKQRKKGIAGFFEAWMSDPHRAMATVFAALAIIIFLLVAIGVSSCTAAFQNYNNPQRNPIENEAQESDQNQDQSQDPQSDSGSSEEDKTSQSSGADQSKNDNQKNASGTDAQSGPMTAEISLGEGAVTWLEIKNGDQNVIAKTVTGPWSQTLTVNGTLTVRASDTSVVTVTVNGKNVRFDTGASGIGIATVTDTSASQKSSNASS